MKSRALKFVLMVGVMSFFADFTYEASRSIIGPYLGLLGHRGRGRDRDRFRRTPRLWPPPRVGTPGRRHEAILGDHDLRLRRSDGGRPTARPRRKLAGGGRPDRPRARRQGDPESAARRDALARREGDGIRLQPRWWPRASPTSRSSPITSSASPSCPVRGCRSFTRSRWASVEQARSSSAVSLTVWASPFSSRA